MISEQKLLENRLKNSFETLRVNKVERKTIKAFLAPLKYKNQTTYQHYLHCLRVGLLGKQIAKFIHLDQKALFYAGLLHDIGKAQINRSVLSKTRNWNKKDILEIQHHVHYGYMLLRNKFDFTSKVILWHHRFQQNGYPKKNPSLLHIDTIQTKTMISFYGRILALADCYDALHRPNYKFGNKKILTNQEIKDKMFELNQDQKYLLNELYQKRILK